MKVGTVLLTAYGGLLALVIIGTLCGTHPEWFVRDGVFERFQTLIAAGGAIVAAGVGGMFVYHQTASNRGREAKLDRIRTFAARARMPHVLSEIDSYLEECFGHLNYVQRQMKLNVGACLDLRVHPVPQIASRLVSDLATLAETAGEPSQKPIAEVLYLLQVQSARMHQQSEALNARTVTRLVVTAGNIDGVALDTAAVAARLQSLYSYGRLTDDDVDEVITNEEVYAALIRSQYERPMFQMENSHLNWSEPWIMPKMRSHHFTIRGR